MNDRFENDISADDLIAKLKENISEAQQNNEGSTQSDGREKKKYKFRRSEKLSHIVPETEENGISSEADDFFVSPVPKSDIEDLDIDALMKKYLPAEDYDKFSKKNAVTSDEKDDEIVETLTSFDRVEAQINEADNENGLDEFVSEINETYRKNTDEFTAPDSELFSTLSEGGKVCDIPEDATAVSDGDTRSVPPRRNFDITTIMNPNDDSDDEKFVKIDTAVSQGDTIVINADLSEDDKKFFDAVLSEADVEENAEEEHIFSTSDTIAFSVDDVKDAIAEVGEKSEEAGKSLLSEEVSDESDENSDELYYESEEIDETDANLMIAFGMDEELEQTVGKDYADKIRSELENSILDEEPIKKKEKEPKKEGIKEYISHVETKGILDYYKTEFGKSALILFGIIIIAAILFFYENISLLGGSLPAALNKEYYPVVNIMVSLQLLFVGCVISFKSIIKGFKALVDKKPVPESFLPIVIGISIVCSVIACFFGPTIPLNTYNFPAALCLLLAVINERIDLHREIMTFKIVSSKHTKFALEKLELGDAELESKAFDKFLPKQPSVFKINKTAFVDGYFSRTKQYPSIKLVLKAFIPASVAVFVASIVLGLILMSGWQNAIMFAYTAFFFTAPSAMLITFGLPAFKASKLAYAENSAFVGESALDEYTSAGSISFDDREVFPTSGVKLRSVKVFGSGRIDTVIYNVASVYSVLGGPLSDVLNVATADLGRSDNTEILSIENEGVEATVDEHHLYLGKAEYLRKKGYLPVSDADDEEVVEGGEVSIMFLVYDDEVVAKIYVRYRIEPACEATLRRLYKSGICVGIKTVDPNINDEMLSTKIKLEKYPVRVLKYSDLSESRRGSERTDSGIVSKRSAKALLRVFTLCDKIKHVTKTNIAINLITMILGLIISIVVATIGSIASVSSIYVALFQMFWIIPIYLMSKFMLL